MNGEESEEKPIHHLLFTIMAKCMQRKEITTNNFTENFFASNFLCLKIANILQNSYEMKCTWTFFNFLLYLPKISRDKSLILITLIIFLYSKFFLLLNTFKKSDKISYTFSKNVFIFTIFNDKMFTTHRNGNKKQIN